MSYLNVRLKLKVISFHWIDNLSHPISSKPMMPFLINGVHMLRAEKERLYQFQREWYLTLYGFSSEDELREHLSGCQTIFDAGCGLGYKAAWLAELAPHALVVGMDFSTAARQAAETYSSQSNLFFVQGDIADTGFHGGVFDYVNCDQVIMHTENPEATTAELVRISRKPNGEIACYFYAKKALPRELLRRSFSHLLW